MVATLITVGVFGAQVGANDVTSNTNGRIACNHVNATAPASNLTNDREIYTFNPDGSARRQLTNNTNISDLEPTWDPDGTRIAFTSTRDGAQVIYIMYQDGSGVEQLTLDNPGGTEDRPGSFTPDGERIAYHSNQPTVGVSPSIPKNREIMIMNDDGTNQTRLTNNAVLDTFAHISPDGSKIAFTSLRSGDFNVHTMDIDGSNVSQVTFAAAEDAHGSWSPDGTQIVFHSRRAPHVPGLEIYRKSANPTLGSTNATRLTNDGNDGTNNAFDAFPTWSPDGSRVLWNRFHDAKNSIDAHTMNSNNGSNKSNVTKNSNGQWDTRCDWEARKPCSSMNVVCGTNSDDIIDAGRGNDTIYAGSGNDTILAGNGNDIVFGEQGDDDIEGNNGKDTLFGDRGNDTVSGNNSDDVVSGSEGTDSVSGGKGEDECGGETESQCEKVLNASG